VREHIRDTDTILGRGACARAGMTSKQVRDCEDSKVEPHSRSRCPEVHGAGRSEPDKTVFSSHEYQAMNGFHCTDYVGRKAPTLTVFVAVLRRPTASL